MKKQIRLPLALFMLITSVITSSLAVGQTKSTKTSVGKASQEMHGLIIDGEGFVFTASEPEGWDTDTGRVAREYNANAVFFPRAKASRLYKVNIRVRLNEKTDNDPHADMMADVDQYKRQYPSTQFADVNVGHPEYKSSVKVFFTPGEFYEYVAYVNPGPGHHLMFSVAMSIEKRAATKDEISAYEHVLRSLRLLLG